MRYGSGLAAIAGLVIAATNVQAQDTRAAATALVCTPQRESVEGRASPYDSVAFATGDVNAKICYGRPSSRGRTMIGGENVPYGQLWRTGANEPTIIHLSGAAEIAGLAVGPGSYSIYTVPTADEWTVIVNRSISQWGHEGRYTPEVRAQEVGRAQVPSEPLSEPIETFTIRTEPVDGDTTQIILEWEKTRVRIPIVASG